MAGAVRARPGTAAVVSLAIAWALVMHTMGWAQSAHYAQVRALAAGQAEIDPWHWETKDKAWVDRHFYSVKAPGLAALTLPPYLALDGIGADGLAREAALGARSADPPRWSPKDEPALENYGYDPRRAHEVQTTVEAGTPLVWALTLVGAVLPALALLVLVRRVADRLEPGYGTAAAITLGTGTILMTFASEFFSHVAAATFGFGAFALLLGERDGPPRLGLVAAAGLAAGLAVTFEYQLGLVGLVLLVYALARPGRAARAAAYGGAAVAGALPALAFNWWALGSPVRFAYGDAVATQGITGHDSIGLNDDGLFGISLPSLDGAIELLFSGRGLLTLTPVLVMAVVGVVLIRRRGQRLESAVIAAVALAYFLYNAGYWLPLGGGSPGPRFLMPVLPFLAVGLAAAYRWLPALTVGLAIPSATFMLAGALTFPLLGDNGTVVWAEWLWAGNLEHTVLTVLGVDNTWLAAAPVIAAVAAAVLFAWRATPGLRLGDPGPAIAAVLAWAVMSALGPSLAGDEVTPLGEGGAALRLVAIGAGASLATLLLLRYVERGRGAPARPAVVPEAAAGERIS